MACLNDPVDPKSAEDIVKYLTYYLNERLANPISGRFTPRAHWAQWLYCRRNSLKDFLDLPDSLDLDNRIRPNKDEMETLGLSAKAWENLASTLFTSIQLLSKNDISHSLTVISFTVDLGEQLVKTSEKAKRLAVYAVLAGGDDLTADYEIVRKALTPKCGDCCKYLSKCWKILLHT